MTNKYPPESLMVTDGWDCYDCDCGVFEIVGLKRKVKNRPSRWILRCPKCGLCFDTALSLIPLTSLAKDFVEAFNQ